MPHIPSENRWNTILDWPLVADDRGADTSGVWAQLTRTFSGQQSQLLQTFLRILEKNTQGKVVLQLGCGHGHEAFALLKLGACQVIGLDQSAAAIDFASDMADKLGLSAAAKFLKYEPGEILPVPCKVDIVCAIGAVEYVTAKKFTDFVKLCGTKKIFFSFSEKHYSVLDGCLTVYRSVTAQPRRMRYSQESFRKLLFAAGISKVKIFREGRNSFATTLDL